MTTTKRPATGQAHDRTRTREVRALKSAARWLTRRGEARENKETKRAYTMAAKRIADLTHA